MSLAHYDVHILFRRGDPALAHLLETVQDKYRFLELHRSARYFSLRPIKSKRLLAVDLSTVANLHNEDAQRAVHNAADDSVIAYAVFPELTQLQAVRKKALNDWSAATLETPITLWGRGKLAPISRNLCC